MFTINLNKIIRLSFIKFFRNIPESGDHSALIINIVSQPFCIPDVLWLRLFSNFITGNSVLTIYQTGLLFDMI